MLSICIPHYNFQNQLLFKKLSRQCRNLKIIFEIIIADDASELEHKSYLKEFETDDNFKIIYIDDNIGRAKIRNLLVKNSQYKFLLFLDGDSGIDSDTFIQDYLHHAVKNNIISGGRIYKPLRDNNFKLHWTYGTKTESVADKNFHSNNFLIRRDVFDKVLFDESLTKYGYEDVVFGKMVCENGFKIKKIDNPVIHLQLKNNKQFLDDIVSALENIVYLYHNKPNILSSLNLPIFNFYSKLRRFRLHYLLNFTEKVFLIFLYKILLKNEALFPLSFLKLYKVYILNKLFRVRNLH